ncbi:glycogen synthase GlgA [Vibrio marisflavi]|uniref:Glycogen synthase n=1 Tax=Vibrio marisflavi CECT 7928 TaxID=634439 RepID=A0ABN8E9M9_9VIBR|nr:glycogen synthase GlgA [Vibrio marisflavi]CAH0540549.1 Glycogen synthase [Vibrio marisflavi CECT 7928]
MATKSLSILFVASEAEGLIKSGGLADVAKALPEALLNLDQDVRLCIPAYRKVSNIQESKVLLETRIDMWPHTEYKVRELSIADVPVYAIDCPKYFDREEMYAENNQAYADNGERFAFFSAACLDMLRKLSYKPDVIHANDWHTGLVPYLLKNRYKEDTFYSSMKSVLTVHNAVFKGVFSYEELHCLLEFHSRFVPEAAISSTHVTMLKAGVMSADKINAVSPSYAEELKTELGGHGMHKEFKTRERDLVGILNGCDYSSWNPETDEFLPQAYSSDIKSMKKGKKLAKSTLQGEVGLKKRDVAMYGMVCRLTNQKGIHYLLPILDKFLSHDVQLVIVGTGDPILASQLKELSAIHGEKFAFIEAYNNRLAHLVEAGSDFFLMPSEFEPCGLNQIYSMAYGTLPIVRGVGGLKDSVIDYYQDRNAATGFVFYEPTPVDLLLTLLNSLLLYTQNPKEMERLQSYAMKQDFCWKNAAQEYLDLYYSA